MINYDLIGRTLIHPMQRRILEFFADGVKKASPVEISGELDEALGNVSYHVSILSGRHPNSRFADSPLLELVATEPRRGAVEHFYAPTELAKLTPAVLRSQLKRLSDAAEGEGRR